MNESPIPLTAEERASAEASVAARQRTAWIFTGLAAFAVIAFAARRLSLLLHPGRNPGLLLVLLALLAVVGFLVWRLGWKPLGDLKADLAAGMKTVRRVKLRSLDTQQNAYGQTITWAHVVDDAGRRARLLDKSGAFAGLQAGADLEVEMLPKSRLALAARKG